MEQTKGLLLALGAAILVLLGLFLTMGAFYRFTTDHTEDYFVRIDNSRVGEISPHGGMNYRYTLQAFTADGTEKQVDFDTSKILREGTFACLKVAPVRGIISWTAVPYEMLPPAVQEKYGESVGERS